MLQSETPRYVSSSFSSVRNAFASAELRMSGSRDDFQQRRAGAVQVDEAVGLAGGFVVQALAGVFFQMGADDADALRLERALRIADLETAVLPTSADRTG